MGVPGFHALDFHSLNILLENLKVLEYSQNSSEFLELNSQEIFFHVMTFFMSLVKHKIP